MYRSNPNNKRMNQKLPLAPLSYIRILHASPDAPPVDIYANGNILVEDLPYTQFTNYLPVNPGNYLITVFPTGQTMNPVIETMITVPSGAAYTVAAKGMLADIELFPIPEKYIVPMPMQMNRPSQVRFIHLSPNAPPVDITLPDGTILFGNVPYEAYTEYISVTPGTYTLLVKPAGTNQTVLTIPNVNLMPGRTYSAYAVGLVGDEPPLEALLTLDGTY